MGSSARMTLGVLHQGAGNGDTLLLPTGKRSSPLQSRLGDIQPLKGSDGHGTFLARETCPRRLLMVER